MANPNSLANRLKSRLSDPIFDNSNKSWYVFLSDHILTIRNGSKLIEISLEDKNTFKDRFQGFLRKVGIDQRLDWLILIINNLTNSSDFVTRDFLYVCDQMFITELYRKYKTSSQLKK